MAESKGKLRYTDGEIHEVSLSVSDSIRAHREYAKPEHANADGSEMTVYAAYLAAKRAGLPHAELEFITDDGSECWADHVIDFTPELTEASVMAMMGNGTMKPEAGLAWLASRAREEAKAQEETDDDPGEASATPAS